MGIIKENAIRFWTVAFAFKAALVIAAMSLFVWFFASEIWDVVPLSSSAIQPLSACERQSLLDIASTERQSLLAITPTKETRLTYGDLAHADAQCARKAQLAAISGITR